MDQFDILVDNAYSILEKLDKPSNIVIPDVIVEIGTTRLHWKNIKEILKTIDRNPDHFMEWIKSELPNFDINWFSASKSDGLIIHGQRQKKSDIINILLKYINYYVVCSSCKNSISTLSKINSKQFLFTCSVCGSTKTL